MSDFPPRLPPETDPETGGGDWRGPRPKKAGLLTTLIRVLVLVALAVGLVLPFTPFAGRIKRGIQEIVKEARGSGEPEIVEREVIREVPVEVIKETVREVEVIKEVEVEVGVAHEEVERIKQELLTAHESDRAALREEMRRKEEQRDALTGREAAFLVLAVDGRRAASLADLLLDGGVGRDGLLKRAHAAFRVSSCVLTWRGRVRRRDRIDPATRLRRRRRSCGARRSWAPRTGPPSTGRGCGACPRGRRVAGSRPWS